MKVIVFVSLFVVTVGAVITISVKMQQRPELQRGTLKWYAQQARDKGEQQAVIPAPLVNYAGSDSMEEALSYYSIVIAEPIEERTYIHNSDEILTWYKFKIVETLSQKTAPPCSPCLSYIDPPNELLPLNADEFLVAKYGGTVMVDDMKVTMKDLNYPPFSISKRYLLLVSIKSSGDAAIGGGPMGVFTVGDNGALESINKKPDPIKLGIQNRFGNSVSKLREHFKGSSN